MPVTNHSTAIDLFTVVCLTLITMDDVQHSVQLLLCETLCSSIPVGYRVVLYSAATACDDASTGKR